MPPPPPASWYSQRNCYPGFDDPYDTNVSSTGPPCTACQGYTLVDDGPPGAQAACATLSTYSQTQLGSACYQWLCLNQSPQYPGNVLLNERWCVGYLSSHEDIWGETCAPTSSVCAHYSGIPLPLPPPPCRLPLPFSVPSSVASSAYLLQRLRGTSGRRGLVRSPVH